MLEPMPRFDRQLRCGRYAGSTSCTPGATSASGPAPPVQVCGIADGFSTNDAHSGAGTAAPTHERRRVVPGRPVETDGTASSDASTMLRNSPTPPRIVVPALFCQVKPNRGLRSMLFGAVLVR